MKNLPNIITAFRLILVPVFSYYLCKEEFFIAFLVFAIAAWSDVLDGYLARKYKAVTNFGKICDPLADKALQLSALIILFLIGKLRIIFVIIILLKELTLILGGILLYKKKLIVPAQWYGKFASLLLNSAIAATILFPLGEIAVDIIISISVAVTLFALLMYIKNYINIYRESKVKTESQLKQ
ncbi:MAG: CDP-diacylglycerol--glycerol-3-phosphate 3-phosphatidyltransferase [Clostridia bacterium]|nr:CDP-diacylglycerol--glycerol-3-phosphate 3-phosphatidyltransferase [Clostridia bacterium]